MRISVRSTTTFQTTVYINYVHTRVVNRSEMEQYRTLRVEFGCPGGAAATHSIYCKIHHVRQNSDITPNGRTLFTIGWPPYANKESIKELYSRVGQVENAYLQSNPGAVDVCTKADQSAHKRGFQICYIVMSSASEAKAGLKLCEVDSALPCQLDQTSVGLKKWTQEYIVARPNVSTLERDAVGVVSDYDLRQNLERLKTRKAGEPDEEGWITVTRKRRSNQLQDGKVRKKKKKELVNLYPWQLRETQREQIAELRRKFEEDKRKVAEMKLKRKFKPF